MRFYDSEDDARQTAFLGVWKAIDKFDATRGAFLPWVYNRVHNAIKSGLVHGNTRAWMKTTNVVFRLDQDYIALGDHDVAAPEKDVTETKDEVDRLLNNATPRQREVLIAWMEEQSTRGAARKLGITHQRVLDVFNQVRHQTRKSSTNSTSSCDSVGACRS